MRITGGLDLAKELHWATVITDTGEILVDRKLPNDPTAIQLFIDELNGFDGDITLGLDMLGGVAALATAMLATAGIRLVHVPGLAVNRARQGTRGGERKSDPKDARVIADQVRTRTDLRVLDVEREIDLDLRLLASRRHDLTQEQTRRINRMHDLLVAIFPGLERILDLTTKTGMHFVLRYATPHEIRNTTRGRLRAWLKRAGGPARLIDELADRAIEEANKQTIRLPAEAMTAEIVRELAAEALTTRERIAKLDKQIRATLADHPDAALILSLPGMGATLTADLIGQVGDMQRFHSADALAAAAGLAPVLIQSGKMRFLKRTTGGNKDLKRIFYQGAHCALQTDAISKAFYQRKRREGKTHRQAVIALARRRADVLFAMLRDRTAFCTQIKKAA